MIGLKENVIIGKLIPAGTGMKRYRTTHLSTDEVQNTVMDYELEEELVPEETAEDVYEEDELIEEGFEEEEVSVEE